MLFDNTKINTVRIINSDLSTPLVKTFLILFPNRFNNLSPEKWVRASSGVVIGAVLTDIFV